MEIFKFIYLFDKHVSKFKGYDTQKYASITNTPWEKDGWAKFGYRSDGAFFPKNPLVPCNTQLKFHPQKKKKTPKILLYF
jgi:hypothetical protein